MQLAAISCVPQQWVRPQVRWTNPNLPNQALAQDQFNMDSAQCETFAMQNVPALSPEKDCSKPVLRLQTFSGTVNGQPFSGDIDGPMCTIFDAIDSHNYNQTAAEKRPQIVLSCMALKGWLLQP